MNRRIEVRKADGTPSYTDDLRGVRFGRLLATHFLRFNKTIAVWYCVCDCGNETAVLSTNLKNGGTRSCGCLLKRTPLNIS